MPLPSVWTEDLRARASECDFRGEWKPSAFLQAMQEGAANHAAALGVGFEEMRAADSAWILSRFKIHFLAPAPMGEAIQLRTWPRGIQQKLFFTRDYIFTAADGRRLAEATSAWVMIQLSKRRILPPQALKTDLPFHSESALDGLLEKVAVPEGLPERLRVQASYSAVDVMGHANSARYLDWLCDCLPFEGHRARRLSKVQINYSSELKPGEEMAILAGPSDTSQPETWTAQGILPSGSRAFEAAMGWDKT